MSATKYCYANPSTLPKFLTPAECAELIRSTPGSLATARCLGKPCPPWLKRGRAIIYDRDAVLQWMADQSRGGAQ